MPQAAKSILFVALIGFLSVTLFTSSIFSCLITARTQSAFAQPTPVCPEGQRFDSIEGQCVPDQEVPSVEPGIIMPNNSLTLNVGRITPGTVPGTDITIPDPLRNWLCDLLGIPIEACRDVLLAASANRTEEYTVANATEYILPNGLLVRLVPNSTVINERLAAGMPVNVTTNRSVSMEITNSTQLQLLEQYLPEVNGFIANETALLNADLFSGGQEPLSKKRCFTIPFIKAKVCIDVKITIES